MMCNSSLLNYFQSLGRNFSAITRLRVFSGQSKVGCIREVLVDQYQFSFGFHATDIYLLQVGVGVTNLLINARKVFDKSFAGEAEDVPILSTSVAYGVYMAVSSNLR